MDAMNEIELSDIYRALCVGYRTYSIQFKSPGISRFYLTEFCLVTATKVSECDLSKVFERRYIDALSLPVRRY